MTYKLPRWLRCKESACIAGNMGSSPGLGRFPGEGNGKPLQYSCLGNPMDRGAWCATVHGVTRVRHDLVTKPPPPLGSIRIFRSNTKQVTGWFPLFGSYNV